MDSTYYAFALPVSLALAGGGCYLVVRFRRYLSDEADSDDGFRRRMSFIGLYWQIPMALWIVYSSFSRVMLEATRGSGGSTSLAIFCFVLACIGAGSMVAIALMIRIYRRTRPRIDLGGKAQGKEFSGRIDSERAGN